MRHNSMKLLFNKKGYDFYINPDYDMTKINDSMEIDSDTVLAVAKGPKYISLEVRGEVKVWWNENGEPTDGEYFIYPSEFPKALKELIAKGLTPDGDIWTLDQRLYIDENNWFEVFIGEDENDSVPRAEVVDAEHMTWEEIFEMMIEFE